MKGMQEKESIMGVRGRQKNLSQGITDPRDGFFYLSLTPLMDSYYTVGVWVIEVILYLEGWSPWLESLRLPSPTPNLTEVLLMSSSSICFYGEIEKNCPRIITKYHIYSNICPSLINALSHFYVGKNGQNTVQMAPRPLNYYISRVERKTIVTQTYFWNPCLGATWTPL